MENNEIRVNENNEETKGATKRSVSPFKAFMIGGVLTLAGIAGFKKLKTVFAKKGSGAEQAEEDFIDNVDYVEVDSEGSDE